MALILAEELKKQFDVWAHFYRVQLGGKDYLMRSEAKIVRKGYESYRPDTLIVMANPGSCTAVDKTADFELFPYTEEGKKFVAARPDPTQYQLMNLMVRMNWNCIKIINLSDVCTGNFKEFRQFLSEFNENDYKLHSLFCEDRGKELNNHIEGQPTLLYAWGGESAISPFVKLVEKKEWNHKGLLHAKRQYYRHPRPATYEERNKWLDEIEPILKGAL